MQWLTAILAFATTMLIFSIIVSTLVETIHRFRKSRPLGLEKMLERFYVEVIAPYGEGTKAGKDIDQRHFVGEMTRMRGTAAAVSGGMAEEKWPWDRSLMNSLPVESFMQRLGTSAFSTVLDEKFADKPEGREKALKDIGQKFELYGQEAGTYFERGARSWSVGVAMLVAWVFYVHPYDLIQTYLQQPEVAARVAELSDDALERFKEIEESLPPSDMIEAALNEPKTDDATGNTGDTDNADEEDAETDQVEQQEAPAASASGDDGEAGIAPPVDNAGSEAKELQELLQAIRNDLDEASQELEPLQAAGAPIGWSEDKRICFSDLFEQSEESADGDGQQQEANAANNEKAKACWPYLPNEPADVVWLILGGLLVGLGAPFWAKAVRQITQVQTVSKNVAEILKPAPRSQAGQDQTAAADETSVPAEAYEAAASAPKAKPLERPKGN